MKKIFTLLACAAIALGANAQLVTSTSQTVKTVQKEKNSMWMVRLGVGTNGIGGDGYDEVGSKAGYFFGVEYNKVGRRGGYYGLDFALTSRGYKYSDEVSVYRNTVDYTEKLAAHSFEFSPVIFGWKIRIGQSDFAIDPHIGLFLSVDYAGKFKQDLDGNSESYSLSEVYLDNGYDHADYWRLEVGLRYGVGVWFKERYNLDLSYQNGFMGFFENFETSSRAFMVRLGYAF